MGRFGLICYRPMIDSNSLSVMSTMQYKECEACGKTFKKRSMISTQRKCDACDPRKKNKHRQQQVRENNMAGDALNRLKNIEKKLNELELLFDIQEGEVNTVVRDIEGAAVRLLREAVEIEVERIFDEKIKLVDSMYEKFHESLSVVNTRIDKQFTKLNARPPLLVDVPEKEIPPPSEPKLTDLQVGRLDRAVKYLKRHTTADKRELEETVWHDLSDNVAQRLLRLGVTHNYIIIDKRTEDKAKKLYRLPPKHPDMGYESVALNSEYSVHLEYDDMEAGKEYKHRELPDDVRRNLNAYMNTDDEHGQPLIIGFRQAGHNEWLYVKPKLVNNESYVGEDEYYGDGIGDY